MARKKLFYGWKIVGVSFVTLSVSMGIWYSFSVFFIAMLKEFGWSRAATAGVFSLFTMVHYGAGFVTGSLLDRFGARRVIPLGSVLVVSIVIPILPILGVQTHIRSVRGSNPCTATNYIQ